MGEIVTRGTYFPERSEAERRGRIQITLARFRLPQVTDWTPRGTIEAEINWGRWIAHCACGGAEFVDPEWPVFVCCSCGAGPYDVRFPAKREAIEAELLKRPDAATRNWRPGETLADLRRENAERGIGEVTA